MSKLVIVSNRLPVTVSRNGSGEFSANQSVGGLATGLASFYRDHDCEWIGWPGSLGNDMTADDRSNVTALLAQSNCRPVFISEDDHAGYYKGLSNQTIWPLFHYFPTYARYEAEDWAAYVRVNRQFCEAVLESDLEDATIWVHDYQLMLLPGMLRKAVPGARIGFFLHIPFPSSEIVRLFPWREELLTQLLGADLIGFHTYDYVRHFLASIGGVLGVAPVAFGKTALPFDDRLIRADAFPMGIDFDRYANVARQKSTERELERVRGQLGERKIILSIDRLDYSKGMLRRLMAFERFLERNPGYHGEVCLVLKAIGSRPGIAQYDELKRSLDEAVGRVNGRFGTLDWVPVHYMFKFLPEETLVALYKMADAALLTPLRDGMNLIAKEFLAAKTDENGVLILSELAGAAHELPEALLVNPNDVDQISEAIRAALTMPEPEKSARCRDMRLRIQSHTVVDWASDYLTELESVKQLQAKLSTTRLRGDSRSALISAYRSAGRRLVLLDYDGTLTDISSRDTATEPSPQLLALLKKLAEAPGTELAILSGRTRAQMDDWFRGLPIRLGAEHGVWVYEPRFGWRLKNSPSSEWMPEVAAVLRQYARRTTGSRAEEKEFSLLWDYRLTRRAFAEARISELYADLVPFLQTHDLSLLHGDGYVEIKKSGISEVNLVSSWVAESEYQFILHAGDDASDEIVFESLPPQAFTVRIGTAPSQARYSVSSPQRLLSLLGDLADLSESEQQLQRSLP